MLKENKGIQIRKDRGEKRHGKRQGHTEKMYLRRKYEGWVGRELRIGNANSNRSKALNVRSKCS